MLPIGDQSTPMIMVGQSFSHYTIVEKLGHGGMGVVYKAHDTALDRFVAMKFLPPHLETDDELTSRFITEAKAASSIDHANIGAIYEIGKTDDEQLFIAMAYYEGETLKSRIDRGPLTVPEAVDIALQIATGVTKAHERGIIHRDLKPANVMITNDGVVKIIDFGLAKLTGGLQLTKSGTSVGTISYMSPEQMRGDDAGANTDVWSLGIAMFEMLTGKLPFRGEFETAMMYSILNEPPEAISHYRDDVPSALLTIIDKALQKESAGRYAQMQEMLADLQRLKKSIEGGVAPETSKELAHRLLLQMVHQRRARIYALLTLAVLLGGVWLTLRLLSPPAPSSNLSIAILPFLNLGDSSKDYVADGLRKDISSELNKFPELRIISSSHSLSHYLNGETYSENNLGSELGASFLLKGELDLSPARARMKVRLFDTEKGKDVWEESYVIGRGDFLKLKESIIKNVTEYLQLHPNPRKHPGHQPSADVYDWYLRGLYFRDKVTKDANKMAMDYFSAAVAKDSSYFPALLSLASCQTEHYRQGWDRSGKLLAAAEQICRRSLTLDSATAQAYAILGNIADARGNRDEAIRLLQKAISYDENDIYSVTSIVLIYLVELSAPGKAVVYLERLQELDPTDWMTTLNLGVGYAQIKNYQKANQTFRRAMELNPTHEWPPYSIAYTFERVGETDSAIVYYLKALNNNTSSVKTYEALASVLLATGKFATAESIVASGVRVIQGEHALRYLLGVAYELHGKKPLANAAFHDGLQLVEETISKNPDVGDNTAYAALFHARLGHTSKALSLASEAAKLGSTDEEVAMKIARVFAVLAKKDSMLQWYKRAKAMNPEYDAAYLTTAMDFEKYRQDRDLLTIARQE